MGVMWKEKGVCQEINLTWICINNRVCVGGVEIKPANSLEFVCGNRTARTLLEWKHELNVE